MRRFIRNSSLLHPLYTGHVLHNKAAQFPNKNTNVHLTSFPRSAITYFLNILRVAFPGLNVYTHIHTAASLKLPIRSEGEFRKFRDRLYIYETGLI